MRTHDWDDVREFLRHDQWTADIERSTDHDYFEKTLVTGEVLTTKVSRSGKKTMSPGRFKAILSDQLRLNEAEFWNVLRLKEPAPRPSLEPESEPESLPLRLVQQLERSGVRPEDIAGLSTEEAIALLAELRSRPEDS